MKRETAVACISTFQKLAAYYGDPNIHDWAKNQKLALIDAVSQYERINYGQYLSEKQKIERIGSLPERMAHVSKNL